MILTLIVVAGFFYFFFFSPVFQIKEIKAENVIFSNKQEVERAIEQNIESKFLFFKTKNIFLLRRAGLEKEILEKFPAVKELEITKELPGSVLARLTERKPVAAGFFDNDYFFIDEQAVAFKRAKPEFIPKDLPLVYLNSGLSAGEVLFGEDNLKSIIAVSGMLEEKTGLQEGYYSIIENGIELNLLDRDFVIYFNPGENIRRQLDDLALVLAESAEQDKKIEEYIDLRFDKVFLK